MKYNKVRIYKVMICGHLRLGMPYQAILVTKFIVIIRVF